MHSIENILTCKHTGTNISGTDKWLSRKISMQMVYDAAMNDYTKQSGWILETICIQSKNRRRPMIYHYYKAQK